MNKSKTKKLLSLLSVVLCLAFAMTFVLAFTACDDEEASAYIAEDADEDEDADEEKSVFDLIAEGNFYSPYEAGLVSGSYTISEKENGRRLFVNPETLDSEFVETVYVENENAEMTSDFDENGVAECVYYYGEECSYCAGEACLGHEMYLTLGGGVYDFYPYYVTVAPIETTAETPEIQLSLIYNDKPAIRGKYCICSQGVLRMEVSSLTGEELNIKAASRADSMGYGADLFDEDGNMLGLELTHDCNIMYPYSERQSTAASDMTRMYYGSVGICIYILYCVTLGSGNSYLYGHTMLDYDLGRLLFDDLFDDEEELEAEGIDEDILSSIA